MHKMTPCMSAPASTLIAPRPVRRCSSLGATKIIFFAGSLKQVLHNLNIDGRVEGVDARRQCNFFEEALVEIELQDSGPSAPRGVSVWYAVPLTAAVRADAMRPQ
jgi:hypothetical protein